tara:strand:- start:89 stop:847 length:759 start_codon:yes stop_codon:yes gene_type:complete
MIAKALVEEGWSVTVSVVSFQASFLYSDLALKSLKIGHLNGVGEITKVLEDSGPKDQGFDWVIDATHPFAQIISSDLRKACLAFSQPLLRYARPYHEIERGTLISHLRDLAHFDLKGQRLLMAIGARHLDDAVSAARNAGAEVFARILPSPESLRKALSASLPWSHLALFRPRREMPPERLELALCRKWSITGIVCRQSGGLTESIWREICKKEKLNLWLVSRPLYCDEIETVNSVEELITRIIYGPSECID